MSINRFSISVLENNIADQFIEKSKIHTYLQTGARHIIILRYIEIKSI